jgi:hypothetical protein
MNSYNDGAKINLLALGLAERDVSGRADTGPMATRASCLALNLPIGYPVVPSWRAHARFTEIEPRCHFLQSREPRRKN